jgi:hypothetical protein
MLEVSQDLSFMAKALQDKVTVHPPLDDLYGDPPLKNVVGTSGKVDGSHSAAANLPLNLVCPKALTEHQIFLVV